MPRICKICSLCKLWLQNAKYAIGTLLMSAGRQAAADAAAAGRVTVPAL